MSFFSEFRNNWNSELEDGIGIGAALKHHLAEATDGACMTSTGT